MPEISWLPDNRLASQEGICSMKYIRKYRRTPVSKGNTWWGKGRSTHQLVGWLWWGKGRSAGGLGVVRQSEVSWWNGCGEAKGGQRISWWVGCGEAKGGQRFSWWNGEAARWGERRLKKGKIMVGTYHSSFLSLNSLTFYFLFPVFPYTPSASPLLHSIHQLKCWAPITSPQPKSVMAPFKPQQHY